MYSFYNIKKYRHMSDEEVIQHFVKIKDGNLESKNLIIENNMHLVVLVAKRFYSPNVELDDLISVGAIGLIKSINSYDISKNFKFSTYACTCIRNQIAMYLKKNNNRNKIESCILDKEYKNDDQKYSMKDLIYDKNNNPEKPYDDYETSLILHQVLEILNDRDKEIIKLYFGIDCDKSYSQGEIAKIYNVKQPQISKIISKSINIIKEDTKTKKLVLTLLN